MKSDTPKKRGQILEVPFAEKEEAKLLGAWWDPDIKKWFVPAGKNAAPFARWFPTDVPKAALRNRNR